MGGGGSIERVVGAAPDEKGAGLAVKLNTPGVVAPKRDPGAGAPPKILPGVVLNSEGELPVAAGYPKIPPVVSGFPKRLPGACPNGEAVAIGVLPNANAVEPNNEGAPRVVPGKGAEPTVFASSVFFGSSAFFSGSTAGSST